MDISDKLYAKLLSLPKQDLLDTMLGAIALMEGYNGNSITACIMEAADAEEIEPGRWRFPKRWNRVEEPTTGSRSPAPEVGT